MVINVQELCDFRYGNLVVTCKTIRWWH